MSDELNNATDDPVTGSAGLGSDGALGTPAPVGESKPENIHASDAPADDSDAPVGDVEQAAAESPEAAPTRRSARDELPPSDSAAEEETEDLDSPSPDPSKRDWYILKVQSNREDSIVDGLQRRVKIAGLDDYFGEIIIPIEMVTEFKNGKKRIVKRKLYPGYIMVNMQITDDTWFLVRDTAGIGDFTGSGGKPIPMQAHEVARLIAKQDEKQEEAPKLKINFKVGDRVKINEGTFENFEGDVDSIDETKGSVTVMINIFGRSTPVELEYWQVESI